MLLLLLALFQATSGFADGRDLDSRIADLQSKKTSLGVNLVDRDAEKSSIDHVRAIEQFHYNRAALSGEVFALLLVRHFELKRQFRESDAAASAEILAKIHANARQAAELVSDVVRTPLSLKSQLSAHARREIRNQAMGFLLNTYLSGGVSALSYIAGHNASVHPALAAAGVTVGAWGMLTGWIKSSNELVKLRSLMQKGANTAIENVAYVFGLTFEMGLAAEGFNIADLVETRRMKVEEFFESVLKRLKEEAENPAIWCGPALGG